MERFELMNQQISVQTIVPQNIAVPVGTTLGVYVPASAGQAWTYLKASTIGSGATLVILPASSTGSTMPGATLSAMYSGFTLTYGLAANDVITIPGPATYYLAAVGATCIVSLLRGISPQTGIFPPG